jgi:tellurite resistance protein
MAYFTKELPDYKVIDNLNPEQAFVGIMYCLMGADGLISSDEIRDLKAALKRTRFMGNAPEGYFESLMSQVQQVYKHEGPEKLLELACQSLPSDLREAAFIFAADISFSDGYASPEEDKILESIQLKLNLDSVFAMKTIEILVSKNSI